MELDLAAIERAPFVGFVGGPVYISAEERDALVAEVRHLRDENAALERKLNAALVDVVNMANEETAAAEAHEEALDRLRDENAQLDAICRWNREHVATVVDEEFGLRVGGMACEHPCLTGDRCDACGWTQAWEADRG